jgi:hypothetical protein
VRKLLRSKTTQTFLTSDGGWTHDPLEALDIGEMPNPRGLVKALKLEDVELYYCFADDSHAHSTQWDFSLPVW